MRTGRTQENTSMNVRARQRIDDTSPQVRRMPPKQPVPSSYDQPRYQRGNDEPRYQRGNDQPQYQRGNDQPQYQRGNDEPRYQRGNDQPQYQRGNDHPQYQRGNHQHNSMRPTAVGRPPPPTGIRCGECGGMYNNASARYCPQCGSRR
jgi:hypothetical protein